MHERLIRVNKQHKEREVCVYIVDSLIKTSKESTE